jgi:hypothetical protein
MRDTDKIREFVVYGMVCVFVVARFPSIAAMYVGDK